MTITIISISLLVSLMLNLMMYKSIKNKQMKIEHQLETIAEVDKLKEQYSLEIKKNKEIYSNDRRALIAENESYRVKLEDYQKKLREFSKEQSVYYSEMDRLNNFSREMSTKEFLEIRDEVLDKNSDLHDFTGIYILENKTHDKFYVGQSISLFKRAGNHFTGAGNKDIYEDYMRGDVWTVKLIALADSGFKSINALEKHFIEYHHSTYNGYNKTIGNAN